MADSIITLPNGDTVIVNDDRRGLQFYIGDLYKYRLVDQSTDVIQAGGQYVPNVNDRVYHYELGEFRVSSVDPTTFVANLSEWNPKHKDPEVTEEDKYLSSGSGYQSESWRAYLDTRTLPYRLEIDEGFRVYGTQTAFIKIFRGIDTTETGEIISAYYNQNGEYVGDSIPLEVCATVTDSVFSPNATIINTAIRAPVVGYTTKDLQEGEYCTVVGYTQDGMVKRNSARLIIHKTNVYRRVEDTQKRVTGIQLLSSYLSDTEPNKLYVPLNINIASITMQGKVTYSDGSSRIVDVGDEDSNQKMMIYGLKYWSPTIIGTPQKLDLVYRLSPSEEYSRMMGESENGLVTERYEIVATQVDPSLSLKLFAFPSWQGGQSSYMLNYWLFDLMRDSYYKVPPAAIEYSQTSQVFSGINYSTVQTLSVGVNLAMLDDSWGTHRHVQTLQVALLREGSLRATNWRVKHSSNQADWYGDNKEALVRVGIGQNRIFDITCGHTAYDEWLDDIMYSQEPLYDPMSEAKTPLPTHFTLMTRTFNYDFPVAMWNAELSINSDLLEGESIHIRFVRKDSNGDLQLAMAAMPIHNV